MGVSFQEGSGESTSANCMHPAIQPFRNFLKGSVLKTHRGCVREPRAACMAVSGRTGDTSALNLGGHAGNAVQRRKGGLSAASGSAGRCPGGVGRKLQFLSVADFAGVIPGPRGLVCTFLGQLCHLLSPLPSSRRRALRGECPLGPLCPRRVQERGHLREPAHRRLPLRVPSRRVRAALLRGDHPELPAAVLRHLPGPQAAFPLHCLPHVSAAPAGPTRHSVTMAQGTVTLCLRTPSSWRTTKAPSARDRDRGS